MTKDAETWSLLLTHNTVENVKWCNTLRYPRSSSKQFLKRLNSVSIWPKNSTPRYIPKRNEGMSTQNKRTCAHMFIEVF